MPTAYPGAIDSLSNPGAGDNLDTASVLHTSQHTNVNDAVEAIENELGINPSGGSATLALRLSAIDTAINNKLNASAFHQPFGVATLDGGSKLVEFVDAGKVNSGIFDVLRIPNISGAKVLGTGSGGAAIPVDAVPNIPASKTNSGTLALAQIPGLPGSQITSGTVARTRLPADIASNALMKADIAARDAIIAGDRIDGLTVYVRQPASVWVWRADSSKWQMLSYKQVLTADVNTLTTALYNDVTGMSFPATAGMTYAIEATLFASSASSTPDIRYGFSWTGGGVMHFGQNGPDTSVASASSSPYTAAAILADGASPADHTSGMGLFAAAPVLLRVSGTYVCSADGTVQLRHAQMTANATVSTTELGSRWKVESY